MKVAVTLAYRTLGSHAPIKTVVVDLPSNFIKLRLKHLGAGMLEDMDFNEAELLAALPTTFKSRFKPKQTLLLVGDDSSSTAVGSPRIFRSWGKYFPCHSVTLQVPNDVRAKLFARAKAALDRRTDRLKARIHAAEKILESGIEADIKFEKAARKLPGLLIKWESALLTVTDYKYLSERMVADFEDAGFPKIPLFTAGLLTHIKETMKLAKKKRKAQ